MSAVLHIGLVVNPLAGIGGSLALKGSDGEQMRDVVKQLPAAQRQRAHERSLRALRMLNDSTRGSLYLLGGRHGRINAAATGFLYAGTR